MDHHLSGFKLKLFFSTTSFHFSNIFVRSHFHWVFPRSMNSYLKIASILHLIIKLIKLTSKFKSKRFPGFQLDQDFKNPLTKTRYYILILIKANRKTPIKSKRGRIKALI